MQSQQELAVSSALSIPVTKKGNMGAVQNQKKIFLAQQLKDQFGKLNKRLLDKHSSVTGCAEVSKKRNKASPLITNENKYEGKKDTSPLPKSGNV